MGQPNKLGYFGTFGGRFVPETLMAALTELEREYAKAKRDRKFKEELKTLLATYSGRPTPFYYAEPEHQQYLHKIPHGYCGLAGTGVSCLAGVGDIA